MDIHDIIEKIVMFLFWLADILREEEQKAHEKADPLLHDFFFVRDAHADVVC